MTAIFKLFALCLVFISMPAYAQCTNPPAEMGVLIMNKKHKVMQYCNGEVWVGLWGHDGLSNPPVCEGDGKALQWDGAGWVCTEIAVDEWQTVSFSDTNDFDVQCMYRWKSTGHGGGYLYSVYVLKNFLLFDISTGNPYYGSINKATKGQWGYRTRGNVESTYSHQGVNAGLEKKC